MKKRTLFSLCSRMFLVLVAVGFSSMAEGASVTFQDSDFTNVATDWQVDAITARNSSGLITVTRRGQIQECKIDEKVLPEIVQLLSGY